MGYFFRGIYIFGYRVIGEFLGVGLDVSFRNRFCCCWEKILEGEEEGGLGRRRCGCVGVRRVGRLYRTWGVREERG